MRSDDILIIIGLSINVSSDKNENRLRFDEVTPMSLQSPFLRDTVYVVLYDVFLI